MGRGTAGRVRLTCVVSIAGCREAGTVEADDVVVDVLVVACRPAGCQ